MEGQLKSQTQPHTPMLRVVAFTRTPWAPTIRKPDKNVGKASFVKFRFKKYRFPGAPKSSFTAELCFVRDPNPSTTIPFRALKTCRVYNNCGRPGGPSTFQVSRRFIESIFLTLPKRESAENGSGPGGGSENSFP